MPPTAPLWRVFVLPTVDYRSVQPETPLCALCSGLELGLLHPANGSQLEIHLVNVALPTLPSIPCDVSPVFLDVPAVMCRTRYPGLGRPDGMNTFFISVAFVGELEQLLQ